MALTTMLQRAGTMTTGAFGVQRQFRAAPAAVDMNSSAAVPSTEVRASWKQLKVEPPT